MSERIDDIVLASGSPRRLALLNQIGVTCRVKPADIDETIIVNEQADKYVLRLAREKSAAIYQRSMLIPVLAADTSVSLNGKILGKPKDNDEAFSMLTQLSGKQHQVMTAVCVLSEHGSFTALCRTTVRLRKLSSVQIRAYCDSGEPRDKAGSYAIQGLGGVLIESLNGSYSNVVGLPLYETSQLLEKSGIQILRAGGINSC